MHPAQEVREFVVLSEPSAPGGASAPFGPGDEAVERLLGIVVCFTWHRLHHLHRVAFVRRWEIICEKHIAKVKRRLQDGNNLVGSVNCLTRASGALDGLVFFGEASDYGVARDDFLELRQGEVRRRPGPMGENFSGSSIVTSRNPLIHNGATTATKSKRFDAEGVPPCCCRVLSASSERLLATVNFGEFHFHALR